MTTSADIRAKFVEALKGSTDAGDLVFSPFDWPTMGGAYPCVLVRAPKERKESHGPFQPGYDVYATLQVIARTVSPALIGDEGSVVALAAAERLKAQIEVALINNPLIWNSADGGALIEQFVSIDSEISSSSEGEMPTAELVMHIEVKFYQGPEDFFPIPTVPINEVQIAVAVADGTPQPGIIINPQQ
ncbi:ABC transporter permease [Pandoraea sp. PE-S2T-3]|uniref:ABC transporter permease n=1 Tax=Pandoraea sp. PE-S2T-3 TaxID=1986993 RepID=UPI000B3FBFA5|nr:ABC transporter permease [Pandoraea sp. PE-S2T-3]